MNKLMLKDSSPPPGSEQESPAELLETEGLVIVLIGASAVGKSTIAEHLCSTGTVEATPTWATRKPRPGEHSSAYDHLFVSEQEFDRQSGEGGFIDQHTLYGARYGVPPLEKPAPGKEALVVLKPIFIPVFTEHYPNTRIYQIEASPMLLPPRMRSRGQSEEDIRRRMAHHTNEASAARRCAHVIFTNNGPLEKTLEAVEVQIHTDREAYDDVQPRQA